MRIKHLIWSVLVLISLSGCVGVGSQSYAYRSGYAHFPGPQPTMQPWAERQDQSLTGITRGLFQGESRPER